MMALLPLLPAVCECENRFSKRFSGPLMHMQFLKLCRCLHDFLVLVDPKSTATKRETEGGVEPLNQGPGTAISLSPNHPPFKAQTKRRRALVEWIWHSPPSGRKFISECQIPNSTKKLYLLAVL
jgi:hypothetical protein